MRFWIMGFIITGVVAHSLAQKISSEDSSASLPDTALVYSDSSAVVDSTVNIESDSTNKADNFTFRSVENSAFDVGEKLTFLIRYGPVKAGNAIMGIPDTLHVRGKACYRIISEAFSNKFFSKFYRVRDVAESHTDMQGIFSWHFEKHLREGKYHADRYVDFDHFTGTAVRGKDTLDVPLYVQDVLSALYFIRTKELIVGQPVSVDNYSDNKLYPLEVKVHRKERIRVPAGEFNCVVVEPILKAAGIFEHKGRLWVWLTDDERKVPVKMSSKIIIGSIVAELEKMEGVTGG